ncbi:MAG: hypothetical protein VX589_10820 [Myxococcota bacterium]|nr:hypothetical protein [Myxococcota bacterium]
MKTRGLIFSVLMILGACWAAAHAQNSPVSLSNLSEQDKRSKVDSDLEKIKETLKFAQSKLDKARENKDVIQLNCVNDKLSGIKGFLKIAEQAKKGLVEAINKRDQDLVDHEFTKVAIATMRVENWRLEVEGCVGELSQYTGKSEISVQTDPNIREDDPATAEYSPTFEALNVTRPPAVTGSE